MANPSRTATLTFQSRLIPALQPVEIVVKGVAFRQTLDLLYHQQHSTPQKIGLSTLRNLL
jgi:hypothetical protein